MLRITNSNKLRNNDVILEANSPLSIQKNLEMGSSSLFSLLLIVLQMLILFPLREFTRTDS